MFTAQVSIPRITNQELGLMRSELVSFYRLTPVDSPAAAVREAARRYKTSSQAECVIVEKSSAELSQDGKTWQVSLYVFD